MADKTAIEWTDATWNPITGCQIKSPGCRTCYAMKLAGTRMKHHWSRVGLTTDTKNGPVWTGEVRFNETWLTQPLHWSKPRMIFVCAHSDLFYEAVPDEWIDCIFAVMDGAPHTFQVLTKRPERARDYLAKLPERWALRGGNEAFFDSCGIAALRQPQGRWPLPNVWLGTSIEDQKRADERHAAMEDIARDGWLTWVSHEPALEAVEWDGWEFIRWMVSGGESDTDGQHARPSPPRAHRQARDFSAAHGIPYLFKQWGAFRPCTDAELRTACGATHVDNANGPYSGDFMLRVGKKAAGRLLDGVEHNEFPEVAA